VSYARKINADWQVEDWYVGKSLPQRTEIDLDNFADDMTEEDIEEEVLNQIQNDFVDRITWGCSNLDDVIAAVSAELDRRAGENDGDE